MTDNYFETLSRIDISDKLEKKGKFSYLSWAKAVQELGMIDPSASWDVKRFEGMPYLKTDLGYFVEVTVCVKGVYKTQIHPVLDNRNAPIVKPNAFQINTSIQRCLAKAIALHGLGLSIFYGEDVLPELAEEQKTSRLDNNKIDLENCKNISELTAVWSELTPEHKNKLIAVKDAMKTKLTEPVQGEAA